MRSKANRRATRGAEGSRGEEDEREGKKGTARKRYAIINYVFRLRCRSPAARCNFIKSLQMYSFAFANLHFNLLVDLAVAPAPIAIFETFIHLPSLLRRKQKRERSGARLQDILRRSPQDRKQWHPPKPRSSRAHSVRPAPAPARAEN